jgi:hypothetical protein
LVLDTSSGEKEKSKTEKLKQSPRKRGSYKKTECPHCHKYVGNLKNHIMLKHPTEADGKPLELTREKLLGSEVLPKKDTEITPVIYFCSDCKAEVRKGETNCWNCQATLLWDGIA